MLVDGIFAIIFHVQPRSILQRLLPVKESAYGSFSRQMEVLQRTLEVLQHSVLFWGLPWALQPFGRLHALR